MRGRSTRVEASRPASNRIVAYAVDYHASAGRAGRYIVGVDVTAAHLAAVRLMKEEGRQGGRLVG